MFKFILMFTFPSFVQKPIWHSGAAWLISQYFSFHWNVSNVFFFKSKRYDQHELKKQKKLVTESGLSRNTPVSSTWIEPLYLASFLIFMMIFNWDILKYWSRRLNEFAWQFNDLISPLSIYSIHCTSLKRELINAVVQRCSIKMCLRPATLLKRRLWRRFFPVNFAKFFKTLIFIEHLWWLLLHWQNWLVEQYLG